MIKLKYVKLFDNFNNKFLTKEELIDKLKSGEEVRTKKDEQLKPLKLKYVNRRISNLCISEIPELAGLKFEVKYIPPAYFDKHFSDPTNDFSELGTYVIKKISSKSDISQELQSLIDKLKSGDLVETTNQKLVQQLMMKVTKDKSGNNIGISELPQLKGLMFELDYNKGTYSWKLISK
jgi:hypothetical protein